MKRSKNRRENMRDTGEKKNKKLPQGRESSVKGREEQRDTDLNWQSQPWLPFGTVVRLELGMSLGNQL